MDLYTFVIETFTINQTRSLHHDTLRLTTTAQVNGDAVANAYFSLGDFNNGDYTAADFVPAGEVPGLAQVVINNPEAMVAFIFQLVNAGHGTDSTLTARMAASADQLAGITAGLAGAGATTLGAALSSSFLPAGLLLEAFANVWSWLNVDCDGPVAVDQISGPRFVLDAWTDTADQKVHVYQDYPGSQSPDGCNDSNSDYVLTWSLRHWRSWLPVGNDAGHPLLSSTGLAAAEHHGGLHVFGSADGQLTHARTFTGQTWDVDTVGSTGTALPASAVSFDDRLYVFTVQDLSISALAYTVDGGTWQPLDAAPPALQTNEAAAAAVYRNRLYLAAHDYGSGALQLTSTADLHIWNPWETVPPTGLVPTKAVAAAALHGTLYLFGLYPTGKPPESVVVVQNSTADGSTWTGWDLVEAGVRPDGSGPSDEPTAVAAAVFRDRLYLAVPWQSGTGQDATSYLTVNFTADGANWSGWRIPQSDQSDLQFRPAASPALAAVDGHLYVVSPGAEADGNKHIWAY